MKTLIILKSLLLINFKGAKELLLEFDHTNSIYGDNATGKTTIFDAFLWLFFGKDTTDRKDFEIKTLDSRGQVIKKIDHEVEAVLLVNGEETTIKRTLREKWQKTRGQLEPEFKGNETLCEWNGVPMQIGEFQSKINGLIQENIFKLITNTQYFNSTLKWQERRAVLMSIAGEISNEQIAEGDTDFENLLKEMGKDSMEDFRKKINSKKQKVKDVLELIPTRIDEANRSIKDSQQDWTAIEKELAANETALIAVEDGLLNEAAAAKEQNTIVLNKQQEIHNMKSEIATIEHNIRSSVQRGKLDRDAEIKSKERELQTYQNELKEHLSQLDKKSGLVAAEISEQTALRSQWAAINQEKFQAPAPLVFNDKDFCCPTCKRAYEASDIEEKKSEMVANFNTKVASDEKAFNELKNQRLSKNKNRGMDLATSIKKYQTEIDALKTTIAAKEIEIKELDEAIISLKDTNQSLTSNESTSVLTQIANSPEISAKKTRIATLEQECIVPPNKTVQELKEKKSSLVSVVDGLKTILGAKDQIKKTKERIADLEKQERELAAEVAAIEGTEYTINRFGKATIEVLESRINGRFKFVTFKMFDTQVNGAEVETCQTLVKGVPFSDANNAARINAGLDIIRTLSEHYGVSAPIFIDNAESVVSLVDVESQIIRLVVSGKDKKLRLERQQMEAVA